MFLIKVVKVSYFYFIENVSKNSSCLLFLLSLLGLPRSFLMVFSWCRKSSVEICQSDITSIQKKNTVRLPSLPLYIYLPYLTMLTLDDICTSYPTCKHSLTPEPHTRHRNLSYYLHPYPTL